MEKPKRFSRLQFRLTASVGIILLLSAMALFGSTYFLMNRSLARHDRSLIQSKSEELSNRLETVPQSSLTLGTSHPPHDNRFFLRLLSSDGKLISADNPYSQEAFDWTQLPGADFKSSWSSVPQIGDEDKIDVLTVRLKDSRILQVGKTSSDRELELESLLKTYLTINVLVLGLSFLLGLFVVHRILTPIQDLVRAMGEVSRGDVSTRVSRRGSGDELDQLVALFNQMLEKIEKLLKAHRAIIDDVAHDIRTPISQFRISAELALESNDPQSQREALSDALESSEKITQLVNTIMDISGVESGAIRLQPTPVSVSELVSRVISLYEFVAEEKSIQIENECHFEGTFSMDESQMSRALANSLDNSIKYSQKNTRVVLGARPSESKEGIIFFIKDSGVGISEKDLPHIWNRLYRADNSRSEAGVGLGLSLVKAIVEGHGGSVSIESAPGQGTTLLLFIPKRG